jgi:hypothetical protein
MHVLKLERTGIPTCCTFQNRRDMLKGSKKYVRILVTNKQEFHGGCFGNKESLVLYNTAPLWIKILIILNMPWSHIKIKYIYVFILPVPNWYKNNHSCYNSEHYQLSCGSFKTRSPETWVSPFRSRAYSVGPERQIWSLSLCLEKKRGCTYWAHMSRFQLKAGT